MQFKTAHSFSIAQLRHWLDLLLAAEMRLKGSPVYQQTVISHLLFSMLSPKKETIRLH
jgi:DNA polymerase-3 subunit delta